MHAGCRAPTPRLPSSPGGAVPGQRPGVPHGLPQLHLLGRQVAVQESHRLLGQQGAAHRGGQARAPARADDLCTRGFRGRRAAAPQPTTRLGPQQRPAPDPARHPSPPAPAPAPAQHQFQRPEEEVHQLHGAGVLDVLLQLGLGGGDRQSVGSPRWLGEMELQALCVGRGGVASILGRGASVWAWLQRGGVVSDGV